MKDLLNADYNSLNTEERKTFVKLLIEKKRTQHGTKKALPLDLIDKFKGLALRLSPENLHCDGEISATQAQKRYSQIQKEWRELERLAGRGVSESEFPY